MSQIIVSTHNKPEYESMFVTSIRCIAAVSMCYFPHDTLDRAEEEVIFAMIDVLLALVKNEDDHSPAKVFAVNALAYSFLYDNVASYAVRKGVQTNVVRTLHKLYEHVDRLFLPCPNVSYPALANLGPNFVDTSNTLMDMPAGSGSGGTNNNNNNNNNNGGGGGGNGNSIGTSNNSNGNNSLNISISNSNSSGNMSLLTMRGSTSFDLASCSNLGMSPFYSDVIRTDRTRRRGDEDDGSATDADGDVAMGGDNTSVDISPVQTRDGSPQPQLPQHQQNDDENEATEDESNSNGNGNGGIDGDDAHGMGEGNGMEIDGNGGDDVNGADFYDSDSDGWESFSDSEDEGADIADVKNSEIAKGRLEQVEVRGLLQVLYAIGEYQEVVPAVFECHGFEVVLGLLRSRNPFVLVDTLHAIGRLLAHNKFGRDFIEHGGLRLLFSVPCVKYLSGGLAACLAGFSSNLQVIEQICLLPNPYPTRLVGLGVQLLGMTNYATKMISLFLSEALTFRALIEIFEDFNGLDVLLRRLSDATEADKRDIAANLALCLRQYFRTCFLLRVYAYKLGVMRQAAAPAEGDIPGASAPIPGYKSVNTEARAMEDALETIEAARKPRDERRNNSNSISNNSGSHNFRHGHHSHRRHGHIQQQQQQQQRHGEENNGDDFMGGNSGGNSGGGGGMESGYDDGYGTVSGTDNEGDTQHHHPQLLPLLDSVVAFRVFLERDGMRTVLKTIGMCSGSGSSLSEDLLQYCLEIIHVITFIPRSHAALVEPIAAADSPAVGMAVVLDAARREDSPGIMAAALNVIVNCVCLQPARSCDCDCFIDDGGDTNSEGSEVATLRRIWSCVRNMDGVNLFLKLLSYSRHMDAADEVHRLACRALLGMTRDQPVSQILATLDISSILAGPLKQPAHPDKVRHYEAFRQYGIELISKMYNKNTTHKKHEQVITKTFLSFFF